MFLAVEEARLREPTNSSLREGSGFHWGSGLIRKRWPSLRSICVNSSDQPQAPHNYTESIPVAAVLALSAACSFTPNYEVKCKSPSFPLPLFLLQGVAVSLSGMNVALFKWLKTWEEESSHLSPPSEHMKSVFCGSFYGRWTILPLIFSFKNWGLLFYMFSIFLVTIKVNIKGYPVMGYTWCVTMSMSLVTELARSDTEELARRPESSGFWPLGLLPGLFPGVLFKMNTKKAFIVVNFAFKVSKANWHHRKYQIKGKKLKADRRRK